jgi:signal transduction histidine kinase
VAVEDTGVGIAAEQLPYVFERFFRGDPARGRTEGAGLGLAIARWIADVHGATLSIASRLGEGTRVTLTFPAAG